MSIREVTRQYRITQWKGIIQDRISSSLTVDEYCKKNGISRHAYFYWLRLIRQEEILKLTNSDPSDVQDSNEISFCELSEPKTENELQSLEYNWAERRGDLTVHVNGISIQVSEATSDAFLKRVLEVVKYVK